MKNKTSKLADISLLIVALIWGMGFVATEYAIDSGMSTSFIMALRFFIASITLLSVFFKDIKKSTKKEILHGSIAGIFLFIAFYTQTIGQAHTTISNCAFLTATNVVMVPFIVWVITKKRPDIKTFILSATSLIGIAILTLKFTGGSLTFGLGDLIVLLCAFFFALHISYLGVVCSNYDPKRITFWQITVAGVISTIFLLAFDMENITLSHFTKGILPVLYLGIFSTCLCYFIQVKAQNYTSPAKAGVFLSMEGLYGSTFSVILGFETLSLNLIVGGIIIIMSVVFMALDTKIFIKRDN